MVDEAKAELEAAQLTLDEHFVLGMRAWPPRGPNAGVQFSFLQIIKHRMVTINLTAFSVMGLDS
jgi:hypothetical protein